MVTEEELERMKKEAQVQINRNTRKEIHLPGNGKLISDFAKEILPEISNKNTLFYRPDLKSIVEIDKIKLKKDTMEVFTGFIITKPNRFITKVEDYIIPGYIFEDKKLEIYRFIRKSIHSDLANTLLSSEIIQQGLPSILRIFTIPIPVLYNGELTFPKTGYDERFNSWLPFDAPKISYPDMNLNEAKEIINNIYKEFCFESKQDYNNAVAGLLTPYLRGLYSSFNKRAPVFFYVGNRERCGKDYCAGITGIIYEGFALEDSPISNSENERSNNTDELRKKILSAFIYGRKRMHFSNNKGKIDNAVFEAITTSERWSDRILGRSEILSFDNEIDFSLSANVGFTMTPDLANRCKFIKLFLPIEDANSRKFENPSLHNWVKDNRSLILSALYTLVRNWIEIGAKPGSIPFTSYPEWSRVCGGIMESAGFDNPCKPDSSMLGLSVDTETANMKLLFELAYEKFPDYKINKKQIRELIRTEDSEGIFAYLDFNNHSDVIRFGMIIQKFINRELSGITLRVIDSRARPDRMEFLFTKSGYLGSVGSVFPAKEYTNIVKVVDRETPPTPPTPPNQIEIIDNITIKPHKFLQEQYELNLKSKNETLN